MHMDVCVHHGGGGGGQEGGKKIRERKRGRAKEAPFHRETKIAVINGPELGTKAAFF